MPQDNGPTGKISTQTGKIKMGLNLGKVKLEQYSQRSLLQRYMGSGVAQGIWQGLPL